MKKIKPISFGKTLLINLGTFLVMLLILFLIGEGIARLAHEQTKAGPTAVNMKIFEASDTYVWGHKPGAVEYNGYGDPTPEIRINKLGFRDDEVLLTKYANRKRVLVLGDSFTFGMGVAKDDNFVEVLEKMLNDNDDEFQYEVVNMGSIGYTIDNEYLLLKEKGSLLNPDIILVGLFVGNDITEMQRHEWTLDDNENLISIVDTKHYVDEENRLRYRGSEEPISYLWNFLYTRWQILEKKIGIYGDPNNGPTLTWPAFLEPEDEHGNPQLPEYWSKVELMLVAIQKEADKIGADMKVFAIPMDVQTNKKYWDKYPEMYFDDDAWVKSRPQTKLNHYTKLMGIDFIDLLPYFRDADDSQWLYWEEKDPHWTPEGNKLAAEVLFNNIINE
ncbi:hypothetical protein ACFL3T_00795 [Patescibacteria group bacterium]